MTTQNISAELRYDRLAGTLLGAALGDALGLPAEGLSARAIARRFGRMDRFHLIGLRGFVSDDTEQTALVAQSLARHPDDALSCARAFRRSLLGWFCRLPWGIGSATLRACVRIGLGMRQSGVNSAGNGSAMRASIVGVCFDRDESKREIFGRALAETTHRDIRAVQGALYAAELAAACARNAAGESRAICQASARLVVSDQELGGALDAACDLAAQGKCTSDAARACGTSGYVVHTLTFATFCFLRFGAEPLLALTEAIQAGGDTDSIGAILGAWLGALHGESGLPGHLINQIHDGPFGPTHLRALASCLSRIENGQEASVPRYSPVKALGRNLVLLPVVLGHGFRRLLPF